MCGFGTWTEPTAEPLELLGNQGGVYAMAFSPDGHCLATGGYDRVRIWDLDRPAAAPLVLRGHVGTVDALAFSLDGGSIFTATRWWGHLARLDGTNLTPYASCRLPGIYPNLAQRHLMWPSD